MTQQQLPAGRYGKERPGSDRGRFRTKRTVWWVVGGLIAGLLVAYIAYRNIGSDSLTAKQVAFTQQDAQHARVSFRVRRDQSAKPVDCIVTAKAFSGDEVGRREVYVPAGAATTIQTTTVATTGPAVAGEVYGCSYQVPAYLHKPSPPSG